MHKEEYEEYGIGKQEGPILYMGDSEIIWKYWHKWHYTQ